MLKISKFNLIPISLIYILFLNLINHLRFIYIDLLFLSASIYFINWIFFFKINFDVLIKNQPNNF